MLGNYSLVAKTDEKERVKVLWSMFLEYNIEDNISKISGETGSNRRIYCEEVSKFNKNCLYRHSSLLYATACSSNVMLVRMHSVEGCNKAVHGQISNKRVTLEPKESER